MPIATVDAKRVPRNHRKVNQIDICYEIYGPETDTEPIVLIAGVGVQLVEWEDWFIRPLIEADRQVIVFDNRDVGLSTTFEEHEPDFAAAALCRETGELSQDVAYGLDDMAQDVIGLLDVLEIRAAHIVGRSMGAMIAQLVAISHPERVITLTSIMSTSSEDGLEPPRDDALAGLAAPTPVGTRSEIIDAQIELARIWCSKRYFDIEHRKERAKRAWDRTGAPGNESQRHLCAIAAAPSRGEDLKKLEMPVLIVHGTDDPLMPLSVGKRCAEIIANAELLIIEDMAHDVPKEVAPKIVEAILDFTKRHTVPSLIG